MGEPKFCPNCAADLTEVDPAEGDPYEGTLLGERYRLDECIGVGGMGRVYRGVITTLNKRVAIKLLHPHLTHDKESHARFQAEAHNMAGLSHPNVVAVIDYGRTHSGLTYLVMEYIEGESLEQVLEEFPLPRTRVIDLVLQLLAALSEAHGQGIIHRDLKPENILVQDLRGRGELVKVLDFGIAKLMEESPDQAGLTRAGVVCGTPEYMSPEQARGKPLDARSDLYAVGIILYRLLAGKLPFAGDSAVEILHRHLKEVPLPPHEVAAREPDSLDELCLRALSKKRENRFDSAADFRDALIAAGQQAAEESQEELRCLNCSTEMRARDNFCSHCGTPARPGSVVRTEPQLTIARARGRAPTGRTAKWVVQQFPLPFCARGPDLSMMEQALDSARPGVTVTTLSGEPGVGKSQFLQEVVSRASAGGWRALRVDADPSGFAPPMAPVRRAVRDVLGLGARVDAADLNRVVNLAGLPHTTLPGLAELFGLEGPLRLAEYEVRLREATVSAAQALASYGRGAKALLALDDVDRWDTASKRVVSMLQAQTTTAPLLVILSGVHVETEFHSFSGLHLERFSAEQVAELLQAAVGREDVPKIAKGFDSLAPVTPLRVELVLRMMASGIPDLPGPDADLDEIVAALLSGLGDRPRRALEAASVIGIEFPDAQIRSLLVRDSGDAHEAIDQALAELMSSGWLLPGRPGHRQFSCSRLRASVYRTIEAERARVLHAIAADVVVGDESPILEAMHRLRAGQARAIDALESAAEVCIASFDDERGADLLGAAMRAFQRTEITDPARDAQLVVALARAHLFARTPQLALDALDALEQRAGRPDSYEFEWVRGKALDKLGRAVEADEAFNRCAGAALRMGDPARLLDAHSKRAHAMSERNDLAGSLTELQQGLDMATFGMGPRAEVDFSLWRYLLAIAETHSAAGDVLRGRQHCQHALWQAERLGDTLGQLRAQSALADALTAEQQATRGEQHRNRAIALARDLGDRKATATLLIERARYRFALGRPDEARANLETARSLATDVGWQGGVRSAQALMDEIDSFAVTA
jgi:serine/threonine-protein kinase